MRLNCLRTFGVMQPTGDRWGERNGIATIDRIAGSPWMGREFCRRMYHGSGPMYNGSTTTLLMRNCNAWPKSWACSGSAVT